MIIVPQKLHEINLKILPLTVKYLGAVADMRGVSDVESLVFDLIRQEVNKYFFNRGVKNGK